MQEAQEAQEALELLICGERGSRVNFHPPPRDPSVALPTLPSPSVHLRMLYFLHVPYLLPPHTTLSRYDVANSGLIIAHGPALLTLLFEGLTHPSGYLAMVRDSFTGGLPFTSHITVQLKVDDRHGPDAHALFC